MIRLPPRLVWLWLGAFLFGLHAVSAGEETQPKTLRLVAWNVQNYATEAEAREGLPVKPEEDRQKIAEILAGLRPDVIGLIEMGGDASLADLRGRLRSAGAGEFAAVLLPGPDETRHLAVLSRWPIRADHSRARVPFSLHGVPQVMRRGILDVTVDWPGRGPVRLVGVHFKSRRETPAFPAEEFRAEEFRQLRRHVEEARRADPSVPLVLWGDFNTYKNEVPFRDLLGARGHPEAWQAVDLRDAAGLVWTHYWAAADLYSRIDFLLLSSHWREILSPASSGRIGPDSGEAQPSDHRFLYYEFVPH